MEVFYPSKFSPCNIKRMSYASILDTDGSKTLDLQQFSPLIKKVMEYYSAEFRLILKVEENLAPLIEMLEFIDHAKTMPVLTIHHGTWDFVCELKFINVGSRNFYFQYTESKHYWDRLLTWFRKKIITRL